MSIYDEKKRKSNHNDCDLDFGGHTDLYKSHSLCDNRTSMKSNIDDINGWLYHRIRMCIWKQWKKPRTKYKNLVKLGIPEHYASTIANSRRKYWYISNNKAVIWALNKERLINSGFYDLATAYQSVHVNY